MPPRPGPVDTRSIQAWSTTGLLQLTQTGLAGFGMIQIGPNYQKTVVAVVVVDLLDLNLETTIAEEACPKRFNSLPTPAPASHNHPPHITLHFVGADFEVIITHLIRHLIYTLSSVLRHL